MLLQDKRKFSIPINKSITHDVSCKIVIFISCLLFTNAVFANPVLDNVAAGDVSIQQNQTTTTINQTSQKAIINWQSFNIAQPETTHFQQPTGGVALNRISPTQGASQIYGHLTATGRIILVNPAGFYFGPSAYVNVGGIITSTANITDQDFLNDYYHFTNVPGYNGAIVNQGQIVAAEHGLIALVGGAVSNSGMIEASLGHVVMASGDAFTMSFAGEDLIGFTVDKSVSRRGVDHNGNSMADGVSNSGSIHADGGHVLITASAASGILDNVVNVSGLVRARSVTKSGGEIIISASPKSGTVRIASKIDVSSKHKGGKGGKISITGENILLENIAKLDASGDSGGGKINIGGGYQGQGSLDHANAVVMASGAQINADAVSEGNGGNVVLWSDYFTNVSGAMTARGGNNNGDGGSIETSSQHILNIGDLSVDTSATNGTAGSWLLDPGNLTITASNSNVTGATPFQPTATGATLNVSTLTTALGSSNVTVQTSNDGFAGNGDIIISTAISYNSANSLTLSAYRNITSTVSNAVINNAGSGTVILRADNSGTGTGTVSFTGTTPNVTASGGVSIYYNPTTFGTNTALYSGGTTPTQYMLIQSLGTATDAATVRSLGALSNNISLRSGNFALAKDIDASGTSSWNAGAGFNPIAAGTTGYIGKFDGQNFTISNLYINRPSTDLVGLFARISSPGSARNITLSNFNITANSVAGALAGISTGAISNATVTGGTITANADSTYVGPFGIGFALVGGVVGYNLYSGTLSNVSSSASVVSTGTGAKSISGMIGESRLSTITNFNFSGTITATTGANGIGGVVGYMFDHGISNSTSSGTINTPGGMQVGGILGGGITTGVTVSNSSNTGNVTGASYVGGIVGVSTDTVTDVFSTGNITGNYQVGGLIGQMALGNLTATILGNTYATGTVTGTANGYYIAGLVGYNRSTAGTISNVYNAATVSAPGDSYVGGITGFANIPISNSYNAATVSSSGIVGGVAGYNASTISNSYSTGNISASGNVYGGVAGWNTGTITNAYSTGNVSGSSTSYEGGGIAGYSTGTITATAAGLTYATGTVSAYHYSGGLVGWNAIGGTIDNAYYNGNVSLTNTAGALAVGGIAGYNRGTIKSTIPGATYSAGTVTDPGNSSLTGGVVGWNDAVITGVYSTSTVSGYNYVGGVIGLDNNGYGTSVVTNVYSTGNVTGRNTAIGGIVGKNNGILTATSPGLTYATGSVIGNDKVGGAVGWNTGSVNNVSYLGNSVTGVKKIGAFIADNSGAYTNDSVNNVTLTGLPGDNYFTLYVNNIYGIVNVLGNTNGNTTFDYSGYDKAVSAYMTTTNSGTAYTSGRLFATYTDIDNKIGNPNYINMLYPTKKDYQYLVRTGQYKGIFTDPLTYQNFLVPTLVTASESSAIVSTTSAVNEGSYRSNASASNVSSFIRLAGPQWLIIGNQQYTIINNVERPVMLQNGEMNTTGMDPQMLPASPYRSLTVQIFNDTKINPATPF